MSNGSSGDFGDPKSRSRNWDHPDGLGWQVWRRAQSTALLTRPIQRDLARFRANTLSDRLPLLADIQRRWALTRGSVVNRFSLNLPLLWTNPQIFRDSELSALAPLSPRPHSEPPVVSPAFELSPLSAGTELPKAMTTKSDERATKEVVVQRNVQSSDLVDVKSDAVRVTPTITSLKQQSGAGRPFNFVGPITRSLLRKSDFQASSKLSATNPQETFTERSTREFGGDNFEPNADEYFLTRGQHPAERFIRTERALLHPILMSQGIQHVPLRSRTTLLRAVFRQRDRWGSGSLHGSEAMLPGTERSPRPRSPSTPLISFARRNDFGAKITSPLSFPQQLPVHSEAKSAARYGASTQPSLLATKRPPGAAGLSVEHRAPTTYPDLGMIRRKEEGVLQGQSFDMDTAVQRSGTLLTPGVLSSTATRLPISVDIWRHDQRIPISAHQPDLKFSKTALGFDFPLLASKTGSIPPVDLPAHNNESISQGVVVQNAAGDLVRPRPNMVEDSERGAQHSLAARAQSEEYKTRVAKPLRLTNNLPGQRTPLTINPQLVVSHEGKSSQERENERAGILLGQRYDASGMTWRPSPTSLASTARAVGQPLHRNDLELDRGAYGPGVWPGHRLGDPRVSSSRTPLTEAPDGGALVYKSQGPGSIASRVVTSRRRVLPIGGVGAGTPAAIISLVPLNTVQTYVVPAETRGIQGELDESGISWSGIADAGFGLTENDRESGTQQKRLSLMDNWPIRRGANSTLTLSKGWPATVGSAPLLRLSDVGSGIDQLPPMLRARDAALDMPLAFLPRTENRDGLALRTRVNGAVVQTSPLGSGNATGASGTAPAALVGGEPKAIGTEKGAGAAPVDLDELVEKAWQKLMRKLTIEQERRGYSRWS